MIETIKEWNRLDDSAVCAKSGYVRLILVFFSLVVYDNPVSFVCLYGIAAILDGFDGFLARKLKQTSAFGAWFDVVIDLVSRGSLWCFLSKWGYFVMVLEWLTFVATHCQGPNWKIPHEDFPTVCKMVMAKGFKTPMGTLAMTGVFVLPCWLYGMTSGFLVNIVSCPAIVQYVILIVLVCGRCLAASTELFFIQRHLQELLKAKS